MRRFLFRAMLVAGALLVFPVAAIIEGGRAAWREACRETRANREALRDHWRYGP